MPESQAFPGTSSPAAAGSAECGTWSGFPGESGPIDGRKVQEIQESRVGMWENTQKRQ